MRTPPVLTSGAEGAGIRAWVVLGRLDTLRVLFISILRAPARWRRFLSAPWLELRDQYRQVVVSAPAGAVFNSRSRIFGANIWW
jgi:hypothetical protein